MDWKYKLRTPKKIKNSRVIEDTTIIVASKQISEGLDNVLKQVKDDISLSPDIRTWLTEQLEERKEDFDFLIGLENVSVDERISDYQIESMTDAYNDYMTALYDLADSHITTVSDVEYKLLWIEPYTV